MLGFSGGVRASENFHLNCQTKDLENKKDILLSFKNGKMFVSLHHVKPLVIREKRNFIMSFINLIIQLNYLDLVFLLMLGLLLSPFFNSVCVSLCVVVLLFPFLTGFAVKFR